MTEVIIVVACVFVLAVTILPALRKSQRRAARISCVNNLKQISLGFRFFANDNNDEFPWAVSTNKGGTREWVGTTQIFRHFQVASNEFGSPKILACPEDTRTAAFPYFDPLSNTNISYFINLEVASI